MAKGLASRYGAFASEAAWPFRLHLSHLERCREFLSHEHTGPRIVRIFGASGSGKSFLARELLVQAAGDKKHGVGLYVDVPPGEFEAFSVFDKLDTLLSDPRTASRDSPSFVGTKVPRAWTKSRGTEAPKGVDYGYGVARDLTAQIPLAGPFVKAILPKSYSGRPSPAGSTAPLRFLMKRARSRPVFLVIDNTQFLPFALREMLATQLADAGTRLRLILIERTRNEPRLEWNPAIPDSQTLDVEIERVSKDEVVDLVQHILPSADDADELGATIYRRSEGNLKSVWFQLRLVSSRRTSQQSSPSSYAEVIQTLSTLDQVILQFIVFTVGGLTVANLVSLIEAADLHMGAEAVAGSIRDLSSLGLLVVNGDRSDRVRVEHELVAQVVAEITPEEEKLQLRSHVVSALVAVLDRGVGDDDEAVLYDRLLGIVDEAELRQTPSLLAHVVRFIRSQSERENFAYLSTICRDSVCWDVLDSLPGNTVRSLLDAVQKTSLFSFGLIATAKLRQSGEVHESLASLYEAKFLVQLFRYEEARAALDRADPSKERQAVAFNIMLGLAQDDEAAAIAMAVYGDLSGATGSEQDYVVLRNAVHLFVPSDARDLVETAVDGFRSLGLRFAVATARNNLGIVDLFEGEVDAAESHFEFARAEFAELNSSEVYQPLVNLSACAILRNDYAEAKWLLAAAREETPRSLSMDDAMLAFNEIALKVLREGTISTGLVEDLRTVVDAARRTRDVRFTEVVSWFADSAGDTPVPMRPKLQSIKSSDRVALELYRPLPTSDSISEVPYLLSPHWRY